MPYIVLVKLALVKSLEKKEYAMMMSHNIKTSD